MIAIFTTRWSEAVSVSRHLVAPERGVDGSFRFFKGTLSKNEVRVFAVEGNADAAYAAARVAERRGARVLLPLLPAFTSKKIARLREVQPGVPIPANAVYDLTGCAEALRLLPDSAAVATPPDAGKPVWKAKFDGAALGCVPDVIRNRNLLNAWHEARGILLFDLLSAGFAQAAREGGMDLRILAFPTAFVSAKGVVEMPELFTGKAFDLAAEQFFAAAAQ